MTLNEMVAIVTNRGWSWLVRSDDARGHFIHLMSPEYWEGDEGPHVEVYSRDLEDGFSKAVALLPKRSK